jgi:hypothetical protein
MTVQTGIGEMYCLVNVTTLQTVLFIPVTFNDSMKKVCGSTGAFVGDLVGSRTGARVGAFEGGFVGVRTGARVGAFEGDFVGNRTGARVGPRVGNIVGDRVGVFVRIGAFVVIGAPVGNLVGAFVVIGVPVGDLVGALVVMGVPVGDLVGALVGDRLGAFVGGFTPGVNTQTPFAVLHVSMVDEFPSLHSMLL